MIHRQYQEGQLATHYYKLRKSFTCTVNSLGLKVMIDTNPRMVDFLDVILDLESSVYKSFRKPNKKVSYIYTGSCHPVTVFKNLVKGIS